MKKKVSKSVEITTPTGKVKVNLNKYPYVAKIITEEEFPRTPKVHLPFEPGPLDSGSFDFSSDPEKIFRDLREANDANAVFMAKKAAFNKSPAKRKLQSKREVSEEFEELEMAIKSKCPAKWLFVDLETGDVWHHREGYKKGDFNFWREATTREIKEMKKLKTYTLIKETKEMLGK